jgi:hypothetical protein
MLASSLPGAADFMELACAASGLWEITRGRRETSKGVQWALGRAGESSAIEYTSSGSAQVQRIKVDTCRDALGTRKEEDEGERWTGKEREGLLDQVKYAKATANNERTIGIFKSHGRVGGLSFKGRGKGSKTTAACRSRSIPPAGPERHIEARAAMVIVMRELGSQAKGTKYIQSR